MSEEYRCLHNDDCKNNNKKFDYIDYYNIIKLYKNEY